MLKVGDRVQHKVSGEKGRAVHINAQEIQVRWDNFHKLVTYSHDIIIPAQINRITISINYGDKTTLTTTKRTGECPCGGTYGVCEYHE